MGRRLQARAGWERHLSLRVRLLAAAAGIVAVSLVLGGLLTWVLVRDLELQSAQDQLDRQAVTVAVSVRQQECVVPGNVPPCKPATRSDFVARLDSVIAPQLGGERLLLLDSERRVVYDSNQNGASIFGSVIPVVRSSRVANVYEARTTLGGDSYFVAAINLASRPVGAAWIVLGEPQSSVASTAAADLAVRLLLAGGAALLVALALVLIVSRSVTRPLSKLAGAAEDIAGGNYSRRVGIRGSDEIGHLGLAFDRMAEAVERARRAQRDFLANVSHELKTPLTSLIGFSQALTDGSLKTESEQARAASIVHEEAERVLRMSQELLDLARVEAGTVTFHITAVDLAAQLQQELEIVRPRASAGELAIESNVPAGLPPVAADPERLHQVLDNLLDNAVKYAPRGSTVRITSTASNGTVETVLANMTGDHKPDPERMFERFYRADASRSAAAGGVGLGLAISRELVAAMKGKLQGEVGDDGTLRMRLSLPSSADQS